ncbi:hypothetical protein HAZT_HAZT001513 [Hyalella azteca]|uniref:Fucosyltransferase n=1 Tax=Hyalella azteca TaxID=294128 RepID=A0A6A0GYM8_HYAAZ|nr:hypothetical protein HAZT_HAZT001513 [Hyalella azteca]
MVDRLSRYMQVDVYGECGTLKCPRYDSECIPRAAKIYKFYLSFENSLCDDYITEKFFAILKLDILPVVYGLGEYEKIAPPHSYINALDFPSIRHLANYLLYLDKNHTAYNEYFRWKAYSEAVRSFPMKQSTASNISWCQLCERLHYDQQKRVHGNLQEWSQHSANCLSAEDGVIDSFLRDEVIQKLR